MNEKGKENGLGRQKYSRKIGKGDKKAELQRATKRRKLLAQNFQKVGILFIPKEPPWDFKEKMVAGHQEIWHIPSGGPGVKPQNHPLTHQEILKLSCQGKKGPC